MNSVKIDPASPAPTIPKIVSGTGGHMHWAEMRSLSMEEIRRLASFSDAYRQGGKFEEQYARIGNSVPPLFMRAIALHVRREILAS